VEIERKFPDENKRSANASREFQKRAIECLENFHRKYFCLRKISFENRIMKLLCGGYCLCLVYLYKLTFNNLLVNKINEPFDSLFSSSFSELDNSGGVPTRPDDKLNTDSPELQP
jgi:hypothetical protein